MLTIVGLLIIPFVWAVPCAFMTAELATMLPENGGHVVWVDKAFGRWISFLNSYATLFCCLFEGGVYPVLFLDYVSNLFQNEMTQSTRLGIAIIVIAGTTYVNVLGVGAVGNASVVITVLGISPFLGMILLGFPQPDPLFEVMRSYDYKGVDFGLFLTILLWNTSGYDSLGAIAGEVENPSVTFPRALWASMSLTIGLDVLVMCTGVVAVPDVADWADGTFYNVALAVGGRWLALAFILGAAVSMVGLFNTMMCTTSHVMYGMAQVGTLPAVFGTLHPEHGTPYVAMVTLAFNSTIMSLMPFTALAESEMWFYALSTIFKFLALAQLRKKLPDMLRPYRIPVNDTGMMFFISMPISMCVLSILTSSMQTHVFGFIGVSLSFVAYYSYMKINPAKLDPPHKSKSTGGLLIDALETLLPSSPSKV